MPAATVEEYLSKLPPERANELEPVRAAINRVLPKGYQEGIQYGMIGWYVPHAIYPAGYPSNPKEPMPFASLAAQKNHNALYLMCAYADSKQYKALERAFAKAGKRMDMGKSCLRFKQLEDLPMTGIGKVIASTPPKKYIAIYEANRPKK